MTLSLDNLKKRAKTLLKAWRAGDPDALARIRAAQPHAATPKLADCQFVLAREAGFATWAQLKVVLQSATDDQAFEFVNLGCLSHDDPHYDHRSFHARARQMLAHKPWLAGIDIWCACVAGNAGAVRRMLAEDPELANRPGPHGWAPLICASYSRVASTLEVVQVLLERGADPNAYTMKGNSDERFPTQPRRFTALTGVFGGGSTGFANQPPHPDWRAVAELLLRHGANPADEQALLINQDASLPVLLEHGLKPDATGSNGITLLGRALAQAARTGNQAQVRLLIDHGARLDEEFHGKTAWEHAMRLGRLEIAKLLEQAGAKTPELDEVGQFVSLCMAGDQRARDMLRRSPDLITRAPRDLVHRAVFTRSLEAVKLVLDLGFDPNYQEDNPAITHTGVMSEREDILRALIDGGASLKLRDPWYDSTAIGWAHFFDCIALRDKLLNEPDICLFDALEFDRLDRVPDILAREPAALNRPFAECLSRP
ncbi:MAG: hypothetical protein JO022_11050, partial [Acidobacteriaceae bacterium]|nr:hypothetical protein [Acidobacteriaceae bacterium]